MTQKLTFSRCATAAIAAALATLPSAAMAQDAASAVVTTAPVVTTIAPPVAPPPQIVLPTTPSSSVVQPLPPPVVASAAPADAVPFRTPRRAATDRAMTAVQRRAASVVPATIATAAPLAMAAPVETAVPASNAPSGTIAAVAPLAPSTQPIAPAAEPMVSPLELGLIGSAFAVVGLGVMALFMRRRRDVADDGDDGDVPTTRDILADTSPVMAPRATVHPLPSAVRGTPSASNQHADMVDVGPTAANPFLTRKNRLRRAHFFDRQAQEQRNREARTLAGQRLMQSAQRLPEKAYPQPTLAAD